MIQTKSSWTPLVNKDANKTLFEERKNLILAWFAKWSESQRKELMTKLLELCTQKQLESLFHNIEDKIPLYQLDFTRILPRVLCIYLFSFLDPRSLCRCAQVSWYWRYLTESNELWASKCLRYGWDLIASHSQWEPGIWKKHYIQNIRYLQFHNSEKSINKENGDPRQRFSEELFNKRSHTLNFINNYHHHHHHQDDYDKNNIDTTTNNTNNNNNDSNNQYLINNNNNNQLINKIIQLTNNDTYKLIPWRAPSRKPSDTHRFNYFDNNETVKLKPSKNDVKYRLSNSAGSIRKKNSLSSSLSSSSSSSQTDDIHNNDVNGINIHDLFKHKTIHKSIYPNLSAFTNHHHSITIPWKPTSIYPSRSYPDHNTDKMQQLQYRMIKKDSNPDSHLKNNSKFHKIENNESSIHKLQSNHSKLNGSNKQLNHEIDMVN
uniref:Putative f-box and wd40 domain protein 7 (Fbw7) n=1 Tax=Schistosoma mansoni TaxID=6183 RepID=A0A3Q0KKW3_SCHMA